MILLTGAAARLPGDEQALILRVAGMIGVQPTFLAAIRMAENGGPGREFGVLNVGADTIEKQATECARSIQHNLYRYVAQTHTWPTTPGDTYSDAFIEWMAHKGGAEGTGWAPLGAENDPHGLNQWWPRNVAAYYRDSGLA